MGDAEIPSWLKGLPLAPEFRPTHTEFSDPIAYISKIEKEASEFGICKIIPPVPKPSKRYVFSNLNKSLSKCLDLDSDVNLTNDGSLVKTGSGDGGNDGEGRAVFTTRHQELGQSVKRVKGAAVQNPPSVVHKQVWQSGEIYTLEQFESKSKAFSRSILGSIKEVTPLVIEEMFWKAASEKPIYVEYANDVPGSAFEEPVGQFRYSHRRRRKRNSYQRSRENSDSKKNEMVSSCQINSHSDEVENASRKNVSDSCLEVSKSSTASEILFADETPQSSRRKNPNACCDMEGTAGWKLSNSPWNLQVIASSPGSLTRFMPDDIPGVTSPMVYIGMLFSWFAWHVEDHELHSMNFLHTGSSKTWYAVPGDYAFAFEELIRTEAFGGNVDRLAALSLLGNKTTLISPEVVATSRIPCCRLIQNPGEFVVTFPRAYHVGFSHGFNCGEAANFGTPQWLKVAKDAAVRRAAMNYLPMLSHQQLLYLLTMSFVSRVPRSLLPGVRSSRSRDRQKEERELSVKKAFIEEILKENNVLSVLLGKESSYHAVLWNPDLLPYTSKDPLTPSAGAPVDMNLKENATHIQRGNNNNDQNFLFDEMSLYTENMNDLYLGSDDLSCDFQVDSGTLACVACGILGFPFMSVVQPSEKASMKFQREYLMAQEFLVVSGLEKSHSSPDRHASVKGCVTEDLSPFTNVLSPSEDPLIPSTSKLNKDWNTVNKFLRPRSFCLQHAVEIVELLQCRGGANMLVICHSDYQKIKAPAAAIAEEIGFPFNYTEVPLDIASKEDLNLIDLAIDDEHDECREDWTSKLGINLRYCVKVRKNSCSKQVRHALTLGGLLSRQSSSSDIHTVKWQSRKSRSKKLNHPVQCRPHKSIEKKDVVAEERSDGTSFKREEKIIQYSRRNYKLKAGHSTRAGKVCRNPATHGEVDKHIRMVSESNICDIGNSTRSCARLDSSKSNGTSEMYPVVHMLEATRDISLCTTPSQVADTLSPATLMAGSVEAQAENHSLEGRNMKSKGCNLASRDNSDMQDEITIPEEASENKSGIPLVIAAGERFEMHIEEQVSTSVTPTEVTQPCISLEEFSEVPRGRYSEECTENCVTSDTIQREVQTKNEPIEAHIPNLIIETENHPTPVTVEEFEVSRVTCATDNINGSVAFDTKEQRKMQTTNSFEELLSSKDTSKCLPSPALVQTYSRIKREPRAAQESRNSSEACLSQHDKGLESPERRKRKREVEQIIDDNFNSSGFIKGPCEGLRPRTWKDATSRSRIDHIVEEKLVTKKAKKPSDTPVLPQDKKEHARKSHRCDLEGCRMSFEIKAELLLHKRNRCPHEGCGKQFSSHGYAVIHSRVHDDDRPLKCPWKGCSMSFKWSWARTEHVRLHTGERPYQCKVEGCGLSFRFVSDFSRHRRKTGHYVK